MPGSLDGMKLRQDLLAGAYTSAGLDTALGDGLKLGAFVLMMNSSLSAQLLGEDAPARNVVWGSEVAMNAAGNDFFKAIGTVAFVFGGYSTGGSSLDTVDSYVLDAPASLGVTPASLTNYRAEASAAGNFERCFVFGGFYTGSSLRLDSVEHYIWATPATKGTTPASLSATRRAITASGNATNAFVFGGMEAASVTTVENFLFATPGSKGSAPSALSTARSSMASTSNATNAFVYGGWTTLAVTTCQNYVFATGTTSTAPAVLSAVRYQSAAASNATHAFVFGGHTGSAAVNLVEQYLYATPATKGAAPAVLSASTRNAAAAASAAAAFVFGGDAGSDLATVEQYLFATPATKGAAPVSMSTTREAACAESNRNFL